MRYAHIPARFQRFARHLSAAMALCSLILSGCGMPNAPWKKPIAPAGPVSPDVTVCLEGTAPEQLRATLKPAGRWIVMIPGISSGDVAASCRLLQHLVNEEPASRGIFYDWGGGDPMRKVASPIATERAGGDVLALCSALPGPDGQRPIIDILAHSAGTIIANKAANRLAREGGTLRFRHVLFLGTPHDANVDLTALKAASDAIVNVHSNNDKINRTISDNMGRLNQLPGGPYRNVRMDTSLSGRIIRHYTFLTDTPENWHQYGTFLADGTWPEAGAIPSAPCSDVGRLHGAALSLQTQPPTEKSQTAGIHLALSCLESDNVQVKTYGAILAAILKDQTLLDPLKRELEKMECPPYLQNEILQAMGNMATPEMVRYLQRQRKTSPESAEVLRDVLRRLKQERIRPPR